MKQSLFLDIHVKYCIELLNGCPVHNKQKTKSVGNMTWKYQKSCSNGNINKVIMMSKLLIWE